MTTVQVIISRSGIQIIDTVTSKQRIVPFPTTQGVVSGAAVEIVISTGQAEES